MMAARTIPLANACEIIMGQAPEGVSYNTEGHGFALIAGAGDFGEITPSPGKWTTSPTKLSKCGDIILCIRATIGDRNWADQEYCIGRGVASLRVKNGVLDSHYLWHWLGYSVSALKAKGRGATFLQVSKADIGDLPIPLPPLAEQKRIAGILDAADALRAKRRESLAQLDTLLQSTFLEMFGDPVTNPMGWEVKTLPEFAIKFTDGPFGSNLKSSHYVDQGVRVIRLQNIGIGEMIDDDLAFISSEHYHSLLRNHCQPGDVIIGTLGDPNLRACIIPPELKQSLNKADCLLMRVDESKATTLYVCWLLNCPATVTKALELVRGQTRGRISMGRLKELQVPLPPLDLQRRFAAIVESVERQKARMRAHLAELEALFASLQSRAFNPNFFQ